MSARPAFVYLDPAKIRAARIAHSWSRPTIAGALGVSIAVLSGIERGHSQEHLDLGFVRDLAAMLGHTIDELRPDPEPEPGPPDLPASSDARQVGAVLARLDAPVQIDTLALRLGWTAERLLVALDDLEPLAELSGQRVVWHGANHVSFRPQPVNGDVVDMVAADLLPERGVDLEMAKVLALLTAPGPHDRVAIPPADAVRRLAAAGLVHDDGDGIRLTGHALDALVVDAAMLKHRIVPTPPPDGRKAPGREVPELDDPAWLHEQYVTKRNGIAKIARSLHVSTSRVSEALAANGIERRAKHGLDKQIPAHCRTRVWLQAEYATKSTTEIAAEVGVSTKTVRNWMRKAGVPISRAGVPTGTNRLEAPPAAELRAAWEAASSLNELCRTLGVSKTAVEVWLAEIGIFRKTEPAIPPADLAAAVADRLTVAGMARQFSVSEYTVRVELLRHGHT